MSRILVTTILVLSMSMGVTADAQTLENDRQGGKSANRIVRFYPNPASDQIHFDWNPVVRQPLQLRIYNFLGKKLVEIQRVTATTKVDLSSFGRGLYLYQITDLRGQVVESGKFQIEK